MKEKINKKKLIRIEELSEISKVKLNIISRYVRQKLLAYEKEDNRPKRYYNKDKALKRLKKIKELEKEGFTVKEMQNYFWKEDYDLNLRELVIVNESGKRK